MKPLTEADSFKDDRRAWLERRAQRENEWPPPSWGVIYADDLDLPSVDGPWPPHHPDWSPEANKAHERAQYRWKWEQLAARSLERVHPQPERVTVLG